MWQPTMTELTELTRQLETYELDRHSACMQRRNKIRPRRRSRRVTETMQLWLKPRQQPHQHEKALLCERRTSEPRKREDGGTHPTVTTTAKTALSAGSKGYRRMAGSDAMSVDDEGTSVTLFEKQGNGDMAAGAPAGHQHCQQAAMAAVEEENAAEDAQEEGPADAGWRISPTQQQRHGLRKTGDAGESSNGTPKGPPKRQAKKSSVTTPTSTRPMSSSRGRKASKTR